MIDRRFPLSEVSSAVRYVEDGHARGKVVVTVAPLAHTALTHARRTVVFLLTKSAAGSPIDDVVPQRGRRGGIVDVDGGSGRRHRDRFRELARGESGVDAGREGARDPDPIPSHRTYGRKPVRVKLTV